jgi:hypothetical protein
MTIGTPAQLAFGLIQLKLETGDSGVYYVDPPILLGEELNDEYETEPAWLDSLLEELPLDTWRDTSKESTTVYLLVKLTLHANELDDPQLRYGCYYDIDFVGRIDFPYLLRQTERNLARFVLSDSTIDKQ